MNRAAAVLLGVVVPVLAFTAAGVVGGALWAWWADPPDQNDITPATAELELGQVFGVERATPRSGWRAASLRPRWPGGCARTAGCWWSA